MAFYHKLGSIPPKRHTQFRQPDGSLYHEELVSSLGFSGIYSTLYHRQAPTRVKRIGPSQNYGAERIEEYTLKHTHLNTSDLKETGRDFMDARKMLLVNDDVGLGICAPSERKMDYFYKNGEADEVIFVHDGNGTLYSQFGVLPIRQGDYVIIPRTTIYRIDWDNGPLRLLIIESHSPVETVRRYRSDAGQFLEHSPYCERDIRVPEKLAIEGVRDEYRVRIKKAGKLHDYYYDFSPTDIVGWDGYLYPYVLSIYDFEPITGRIHQPPPVHQTFQGRNYVICSFVPRLFDYHPDAIPAPYNHSNIDSDEVLYYVEGNFMSRKGIDRGSFTLHPGGIPHGPHPGTVEMSIGARETNEYAVMLDPFKPLHVTKDALPFIDENYPMSWS